VNNKLLLKRVVAYIIDIILISLILAPLVKVTLTADVVDVRSVLVGFVSLLVTLLYFVLMEYYLNQTIGKMLLNIHVRNNLKGSLVLGQVILRNLTKTVTLLLVLDTLYLYIKRSDQRYFEVISKTRVVER
jgi:uncharacterized RDD family membrane protein YckC